jgi:hypothetical protein
LLFNITFISVRLWGDYYKRWKQHTFKSSKEVTSIKQSPLLNSHLY